MEFDLFIHSKKIALRTQYLCSIVIVCMVAAVSSLFSAYIGSEVVAFLLLLTLSLIAMFFDILPVLLSALLSALIWDFFFLQPRFNFQVGNTEDKIMLSMYFVIASVSAVLTFKIRQVEKIARSKEVKTHTLKLYNTLLNSLSHEFRTPISTILGAADNLLEYPSRLSGEDQASLLREISKASIRLNQQVENLLDMSRLESGFLQPKRDWCDVKELVYDTLQKLEEPLKHFRVVIEIDEQLPLVKIDYGLMEHVLYNLIHNAALYTPEQTLIKVAAGFEGKELLISVEDNGPGFSTEETKKVFEKFYRPKDARPGGAGLGLYIVKGFVEAHHGTVHLVTVMPAGALFLIRIPAEEILYKDQEYEPDRNIGN